MEFIRDLHHDEIRDGWLVKSDMKKVWQRQLEIWQEVDRICRKHKITYWADGGTLLGAVRHGGFIPWDDDFDICMMRPDYNRFYEVVEEELIQSGGLFEIERKIFTVIKIVHSQTTLLAQKDINNKSPQGLMIDIFPLDIAFDGTRASFFAVNAISELLGTAYNYPAIVEHVQSGGEIFNNWSFIEEFHNIPDARRKYRFLNTYAESVFDFSSTVDWFERIIFNRKTPPQQKSYYGETIYLPFETIELPAPIGYEKFLTNCYGDWHKFVPDDIERLGHTYSAEIPYREFLQRINFEFMQRK